MKISEFVEKYEKTSNPQRDKLINDIIKIEYVPYIKKRVVCENIVKKSSYVIVNNKEVFKPSSYMRTLFFTMKMIEYYTNLEMDNQNEPHTAYDMLQKYGLVNQIISIINEKTPEIDEFNTLLKMELDDLYQQETDLVRFLNTKFDAIELLLDGLQKDIAVPAKKK